MTAWRPTPVRDWKQPARPRLILDDTTRLLRSTWRQRSTTIIAAIAVVAAASAALLVHSYFLATKPVDVTVTGLTWARGVEVQQFRTVREEAWSPPADARDVRPFQAIHHYDQQFAGYTTYSCGSSESPRTCTRAVYVTVPVYRTKYDYEVDRWRHHGWERVTGDHLNRPYWPIPEGYREPNPPHIGDVRFHPDESTREESYAVKFADGDGVVFHKATDLTAWDALTLDQTLVGHVSRRGVLRGVDWTVHTDG